MRQHQTISCLILAACLVSTCRGEDAPAAARPTPIEPLTRGRAAQILAETDSIADDLARQIESLRNPHEMAVIDDIRDLLSHSSEWEWYSRDRGILLAIPVRERLGILASYDGEKVLAEVVRRLVKQKGLGNPQIQVVLLQPKDPLEASGCVVGQSTRFPAGAPLGSTASCNCR